MAAEKIGLDNAADQPIQPERHGLTDGSSRPRATRPAFEVEVCFVLISDKLHTFRPCVSFV
jgi:hypothetical protein